MDVVFVNPVYVIFVTGEYVALYQQQRHILKQRTLEKDNYISHLARDREEMADKLGQLQAAVMQLLQERQMLHPYSPKSSPAGDASTPNHVPPVPSLPSGPRDRSFGSKLDSSQLEGTFSSHIVHGVKYRNTKIEIL